MIGASRRTFKDLQDEVLSWMGDDEDQARMRNLVKHSIATSHEKRNTEYRWTYMIYPKVETFNFVAGTEFYSLHEAFQTPVYFRNRTTGRPLVQAPYDNMVDSLPDANDLATGSSHHFVLHGVSGVKQQPLTASTLDVTVDNVADAGKSVYVVGEMFNGDLAEELLVVGVQGSIAFQNVLEVRKNGAGWTAGMNILSDNSTRTLLSLSATVYGRQYRQFKPLRTPSGTDTIEYQFFRRPKRLVDEYDIPNTPDPFDRIHVLDALLALQGFSRAGAGEVKHWRDQVAEIENNLIATYQEGLSFNSEQSYIHYIPR